MWDNPTYDYKINTKILQGADNLLLEINKSDALFILLKYF